MLLWDEVTFITPFEHFRINHPDSTVKKALGLIAQMHTPTEAEKQETHSIIKDFVTRPLPQPFYFTPDERGSDDYLIYPQKLLRETSRLLEDVKLARTHRVHGDISMSRSAGLSVMSILADCCAGKTLRRITDRTNAYATVAGLLQAQPEKFVEEPDANLEKLVPISLEVIDVANVSLEKLIKFRKKENGKGGHAIRKLRHNYVKGLEKYATELTAVGRREGDERELRRRFRQEMKDDLHALRHELGFAAKDALFSKEMFAFAVGSVGMAASAIFPPLALPTLVSAAAGGSVAIGGLLGTRNKFLSARYKMLKEHPMAYLYELEKPLLAI